MADDTVEGNVAGQTFKFQGPQTIYLLLTAGLAAMVGYMLWQSTQDLRVDMATQHQVLKTSTEELGEQMKVQNYISTLDQKKRESLNIDMPKSLRNRN